MQNIFRRLINDDAKAQLAEFDKNPPVVEAKQPRLEGVNIDALRETFGRQREKMVIHLKAINTEIARLTDAAASNEQAICSLNTAIDGLEKKDQPGKPPLELINAK